MTQFTLLFPESEADGRQESPEQNLSRPREVTLLTPRSRSESWVSVSMLLSSLYTHIKYKYIYIYIYSGWTKSIAHHQRNLGMMIPL